MPTKKTLSPSDVTSKQSFLNQLVDIIQEDVSGSTTRKTYKNFITGTTSGPGVTSSLFQTVFDQSFALQTANAIFDLTIGLRSGSDIIANASTGEDSAGKLLFPSQTLMMREKVANYSQFAQLLMGDSTETFYSPFGSTVSAEKIDEALFINYRRLFARDKIKRETFAMRFFQTGVLDGSADDATINVTTLNGLTGTNINRTSPSGSAVFTDVGSAANQLQSFAGDVGNIVDSANTSREVGLMFYDMGVAVFDLSRICMTDQHISGVIDAVGSANDTGAGAGQMIMGSKTGNPAATFKPDLLVSASIDNILTHIASTRFSNGTVTAATFQNQTEINSTLIFCRAGINDFNYSSNPSFTDANGQIVVLTPNTEERTFSFITTIGLYDASDRLLAVAKLSRPVEKNDTRDLTFRIRLDF
jgi:hypothetical protein